MSLSPRLFGSFLVSIDVLSAEQRDHILSVIKQDTEKRFYQVAVSLGYIQPGEIDAYLDKIRDLSEHERHKGST